MLKTVQKYWYIVYLIVLVAGVFFIRSVIKDSSVKVTASSPKKEVVDVKFVKVTLNVVAPNYQKTYKDKLENIDSVYDLLDNLWKNQGFYYDKTEYLNAIELTNINKITTPTGYTWKLYLDNKDITNEIYEQKLDDKQVYLLTMVKK